MTIKEDIKRVIEQSLDVKEDVQILEPEDEKFGDYATNLAFALAKKEGKSSKEIAEKLRDLLAKKGEIFEKVEVAGNGYLNLFLQKEYLMGKLKEIGENEGNYGRIKKERPEKIQVEFISANPTGPLHLGHGRNAFYGDVLARVLAYAGDDVEREFYVNDARESAQIRELGKTVLGNGTQYQNEYTQEIIQEMQETLKNLSDEGEAGHAVATRILEDIKKLVAKMGIDFDEWFSEQILYQGDAKENLLKDFEQEGETYEKEGALWLKTSAFGDDKDRVLVKRTGDMTYFLADILYHKNKIERGFDKIIDIWGADHQGHEKRMQALMRMLGFKGLLVIPIIQMVRLQTKEGPQKMSKRLGTAVDLEELINKVGKDVVRFMMVSKDISTQMIFDLELAQEKSEKNPVYYLQYALVRCKSILRSAKPEVQSTKDSNNLNLLKEPAEMALIKETLKFPDLIKEIAQNYEVHHLTTYGINLAKELHHFYKIHRVLTDDEKLSQARLDLIVGAKVVLECLFDILGIEKLETM